MTAYADRPSNEPETVTAGDLVEWRREDLVDKYPAATWTLTYALQSPAARIDITASAQGGYFTVVVSAATSAAWAPGGYTWQAYVTSGTDRHMVDHGRIEVLPNFAAIKHHDGRTHARRVLDAIEACIEGKATRDQQSYSIAGRELQRYTWQELIDARSRYRALVLAEERAERARNGAGGGSRLVVRL